MEGPCVVDDERFEVLTAELMRILVSCGVGLLLDHPERQGHQDIPKSWYHSTRHHIVEGWF
jgi:hypothetical protein